MRDFAEQLEQRLMLAEQAEGRRGRGRRLARRALANPGQSISVIGATGAATAIVVALLLTAGATPTVAQALPILEEPPTNVSTGVNLPGLRGLQGADLADARAFVLPYGTGYVIPNSENSTLCILTPSLVTQADGSVTGPPPGHIGGALHGACDIPVSQIEQQGWLLTWYVSSDTAIFVGVLPATGTATLTTSDGTTTTIPITDGIATAAVHQDVTITIHIGTVTRTLQFGPATASTGGDATAGVPNPPNSTVDTQP